MFLEAGEWENLKHTSLWRELLSILDIQGQSSFPKQLLHLLNMFYHQILRCKTSNKVANFATEESNALLSTTLIDENHVTKHGAVSTWDDLSTNPTPATKVVVVKQLKESCITGVPACDILHKKHRLLSCTTMISRLLPADV